MKWWRTKSQRCRGETQGVAAWGKWDGKRRLKMLVKRTPFLEAEASRGLRFFLLVLFVEKKKSDIRYMI